MKAMKRSSRYLAAVLTVAGCCAPVLRAAVVTQLKDEAGKTIVEYIVEAPSNVAPAGTTDPVKQVGVIFCFQEHGNPTGTDLYPEVAEVYPGLVVWGKDGQIETVQPKAHPDAVE